MDKEQKRWDSRPDEAEITCRLRDQVVDLEAAVSVARREAIRLFQELDMRARKASSIASSLGEGGGSWARRVSRLMDILDDCHGTMEGMSAIGLLRDAPGFSWDLGRVFDGTEDDQAPG
jgi:hypothetical protein